MPKKGANISLSSYDDIFETDESRADAQLERVQKIPISELVPFKDHPFKVVDDDWFDMDIIDCNNATLGMKFRIAGMCPKALQKKQEAVSSVISASYNDLYMLLIEGK